MRLGGLSLKTLITFLVGLCLLFAARVNQAHADVPFGVQQIITTSADGAQSVYAADVDGDGDMDVLSASWNDDTIAW